MIKQNAQIYNDFKLETTPEDIEEIKKELGN
ncbi:MAG: hypothetical protein N4J56_007965 [Chroococcidiopsis sp. SAG 2025]|nr:hypothetical protein [Chroococcidiopsis sp. SAG 2025]